MITNFMLTTRTMHSACSQREVYPALVLFPGRNKDAVSYEGDIAVTAIIKFIASQGSHSHHYSSQNGNSFSFWSFAG